MQLLQSSFQNARNAVLLWATRISRYALDQSSTGYATWQKNIRQDFLPNRTWEFLGIVAPAGFGLPSDQCVATARKRDVGESNRAPSPPSFVNDA
jgi:hypothetical protein